LQYKFDSVVGEVGNLSYITIQFVMWLNNCEDGIKFELEKTSSVDDCIRIRPTEYVFDVFVLRNPVFSGLNSIHVGGLDWKCAQFWKGSVCGHLFFSY